MPTAITVGSKTYNLITLPTDPAAPSSVVWTHDENVGINVSPFTFEQQVYDWTSARWAWTITYQSMLHQQSRPWAAFAAACRGKLNVFQIGDAKSATPQGTGGTGTVSGANQTGFILVTSFSSGAVLPGDYIQIGYRLYMVTSNVSGTLNIWPNLRESPANSSSITTANTKGLFRLAKNQRKYTQGNQLYTFSFDIEEAL